MEFEAYRDKLIASYQEGKLAQEKVSTAQRCLHGAQLYTVCAMVSCAHGPFLMGRVTTGHKIKSEIVHGIGPELS